MTICKVFSLGQNFLIKKLFSQKKMFQESDQECGHSMARHGGDDSSYGSYYGTSRAVGGEMKLLASRTLVLTLS